jgi:hypothetical protein
MEHPNLRDGLFEAPSPPRKSRGLAGRILPE